ncbi:MAG: YqgE/AlgH family protein [Alphaproteobacteria bacterium]
MTSAGEPAGLLPGQLLIAMPAMTDPRFERSVIYMCAHTSDGAMGLVLNRLLGSVTFPDLLEQLGIKGMEFKDEIRVHFGGPVESGRGFVLHSSEFVLDGTLVVDRGIALTASIDILKAIASGGGPRQRLLALGYAGWGPGQLEQEIQANGWLHVPADAEIVFDSALDTKWTRAMAKLGVNPTSLSTQAGRA